MKTKLTILSVVLAFTIGTSTILATAQEADYGIWNTSDVGYSSWNTSDIDYGTWNTSNVDYGTWDTSYPTTVEYGTWNTSDVDYGTWNTSDIDYGTWNTSDVDYGVWNTSDVPPVSDSGTWNTSYPTTVDSGTWNTSSQVYGVGGSSYPISGSIYFGTGYSQPSYGYSNYGYSNYGYTGSTYTGGTNTTVTCPSGTTRVNNTCQYPTQCPSGTTLINNVCQPATQCPSGTTLVNGVCQGSVVTPTYVCPNGTVVTYASQCPVIYNPPVYNPPVITYQTCWNGSVIPNNQVCPMQYKVCPNGTSIPINQTCYIGGTYPTIQPPQVVKFNNVVTSVVTEITNTQGRCNGIGLIPNGVNSTGWFEYGETPNLGRRTAEASIGRAMTAPFSNLLTNLKPNTTYYCRAVMQNQYGIVKGDVVSFVTKSKAITYVKPVTTPVTKVVTKAVAKQEITCTDGTRVWVKNESSASLINAGQKLIVLQIEKDQKVFATGNPVSYKITYKNLSDSRLHGVTVRISIPQEVQFVLSTAGTYDEVTRTLTVSNVSIDPYSEATIAISGKVADKAQVGRSVVTSASVTYMIPSTEVYDDVTAYVVNIIQSPDANKDETGEKKVIGLGGANGFLPTSLVEWLALFTIILIIFILTRSIYNSYKAEEEGR